MEPEEIKKLIHTYPIISGWIQELPEALMYRCRLSYPPRGQSLFCRGDAIQKVYIVCTGSVIITSSNLNGNEMGVVVVPEGASGGRARGFCGISFKRGCSGAFEEKRMDCDGYWREVSG